jgi:hypothetical protein
LTVELLLHALTVTYNYTTAFVANACSVTSWQCLLSVSDSELQLVRAETDYTGTPRPIGVDDGGGAVVVLVTNGELVQLAHADTTEADDAEHEVRCQISVLVR